MRKTLIAAVVGLGLTTCLTVTAGTQYNPAVDVTSATAPGNGTTLDNATFNYFDPQPTGTGFIDPFLREQVVNSGTEMGVNTSIKAQIMNDNTGSGTLSGTIWANKPPVNFTHDLAINTLIPVSGNYQFNCDVNQVANGNISLTTFKVYVSSTAFTDPTALNNFLGTTTPVVDINRGLNGSAAHPFNQVNAQSDHGSGSGDFSVSIPTSIIGTSGFLYMVAGFGQPGSDFVANAGFEEWWTQTTTPNVAPDTASALSLLGMAITGIEIFRRKFRA